MDLNELNSITSDLDEKTRSSILKVIDFKTKYDMKETIAEIKLLGNNMSNELANMNSKFDTKFEHVEMSIATIRWVIIVAGAVLTTLLTILALK